MNWYKREAKHSFCRFSCTFPLQKSAGFHAFSEGVPLPPWLQQSPFSFSPLPLSISPFPNPTLPLLLRCNMEAVAHLVTVLLWDTVGRLPVFPLWVPAMASANGVPFLVSNEIKVIPQILAFHTHNWPNNYRWISPIQTCHKWILSNTCKILITSVW